jgi:uncharacterized membrane protein
VKRGLANISSCLFLIIFSIILLMFHNPLLMLFAVGLNILALMLIVDAIYDKLPPESKNKDLTSEFKYPFVHKFKISLGYILGFIPAMLMVIFVVIPTFFLYYSYLILKNSARILGPINYS